MKIKRKISELVFRGGVIILFANVICFILGYLRDTLIVAKFGASILTDAWYVASNIPELLFKFLLVGTVGAAFMPVFIEHVRKQEEGQAWVIASSVINMMFIGFTIFVVFGIIFTPVLIYAFAPGFNYQAHILAVELARIVLPLLVFIAVGGLLGAICNAYFNYLIPVIGPLINLGILIPFIIVFSGKWGIYSVAWGTVSGNLMSFLTLILFFVFSKKPYRFEINLKYPAIKDIFILTIPLIGAEIIGTGIGVVDRIFVSFLGEGAITTFSLANRILNFPIIFFSTTIAVAIFPLLAQYAANNDKTDFLRVFMFSIKMSLLVIIPSIICLIVFGKTAIQTLFEHGKFTSQNTQATWQVLLFLSPVLVAYSLRPILARTCYVLKKNWMLFRYELYGFILNLILDYVLIKYLGLCGIALATTIVVTIMVCYLLALLSKELGAIDIKEIKKFLAKVLIASIIMGAWSCLFLKFMNRCLMSNHKTLILNLCISLGSSGLIYLLILKGLQLEELRLLWDVMKSSMAKNKYSDQ